MFRLLATLIATMLMADYGADVVKFTPPDGFPLQQSSSYSVWDRDKTYAPIDVLRGGGATDSTELIDAIQRADIVISSLTNQFLESIGVDVGTLVVLLLKGIHDGILDTESGIFGVAYR